MSALENIWGLMPLPALTIGPDNRLAALNGAGESFLGLSEAQVKGRKAEDLFGDNARLIELLRISRVSTATAADHNVEFLWPGRPNETVDMLAAERIDPLPMVTDRIALQALPEAFEALRKPSTECKVIVEP